MELGIYDGLLLDFEPVSNSHSSRVAAESSNGDADGIIDVLSYSHELIGISGISLGFDVGFCIACALGLFGANFLPGVEYSQDSDDELSI